MPKPTTKRKPRGKVPPRVLQRVTVEVIELPDGTQQVRNRCAPGTSPFALPAILRAAWQLADRNVTMSDGAEDAGAGG